jgi:hypothetical protein
MTHTVLGIFRTSGNWQGNGVQIKLGHSHCMIEIIRFHGSFSSRFQPLSQRSRTETSSIEVQNSRTSKNLKDDLILWIPSVASHWNMLEYQKVKGLSGEQTDCQRPKRLTNVAQPDNAYYSLDLECPLQSPCVKLRSLGR